MCIKDKVKIGILSIIVICAIICAIYNYKEVMKEQENIIMFENGSFGTITITDINGNTVEYQGNIVIGDYPGVTYEIMGTNVVMDGARMIANYKSWDEE